MSTRTDVHGIYKESEGILINKDNDALKMYKLRKKKEGKIEQIEIGLSELKLEIMELKDLLRGLVK